jgi:drug/metabolite transporter (DMT)-like permease
MAKWMAFATMFVCTLFTSFAQFFFKKGASHLAYSYSGIFLNGFLLLGIFLYFCGAILMILALRGGDLSALYPIVATSYIWVSMISLYFLGESMNLLKWSGVASIILGVGLVGFGSRGGKN